MIVALLLTAQVAPAAAAPAPQSWSILTRDERQCAEKPDERGTIIVCGARQGPRLPLPDERPPPDRPRAEQVDLSGRVSGEGGGPAPCGARQEGCTTGVTLPPVIVHAAIDGVKQGVGAIGRALHGHPDRSKRIPIPLD